MRTTVSIDDHLLRSAKRQARRRGLTLGQLVEEALRRELSQAGQSGTGPVVPVFRRGRGVRPGLDINSNRGLIQALDEGEPVERIR